LTRTVVVIDSSRSFDRQADRLSPSGAIGQNPLERR
jgi:hypothetical protein